MRKPTLIAFALTCALGAVSCKSGGPVLCPAPQPVTLPPMGPKPMPQGEPTVQRELLKPSPSTPP